MIEYDIMYVPIESFTSTPVTNFTLLGYNVNISKVSKGVDIARLLRDGWTISHRHLNMVQLIKKV
jgi:hypothetical protein